jgi:hypothetical protein
MELSQNSYNIEKWWKGLTSEQKILARLSELPIYSPLQRLVFAYLGPLDDDVLFPLLKGVQTYSFYYHGRRFYYIDDEVFQDDAPKGNGSGCCALM